MLNECWFRSFIGILGNPPHLKLKRSVTDGCLILLQLTQLTSFVEGITKLLVQGYSSLPLALNEETLTLREVGKDDVEKDSLEDVIGRHRPTTRRKNLQQGRYRGLRGKFEV